MTSDTQVEQHIAEAFSNITDDFGRPIKIALSIKLLVQLLSDHSPLVIQKYELLGESAVYFAIQLILMKRYASRGNNLLRVLAKHLRNLSQLYKAISKQMTINKLVKNSLMIDIMNSIIGILYSHYGINAVEKFVHDNVVLLADQYLSGATNKRKFTPAINENPVQCLHIMTQEKSGVMEATSNINADLTWQTTIVAKFSNETPLFSHSRISASKSKAKTEACQDIVTYLSNHPEELERLRQSSRGDTSVYVLPISKADYCHLYTIDDTKSRSKVDGLLISNNSDEEVQQLSNLLLRNTMDLDFDPREKKRLRDI